MKIVIDIDDEQVLSDIKNRGLEPESKTDKVILNALYNGISLPKGHGRLIDADNLIEFLKDVSKRQKFKDLWIDEYLLTVDDVFNAFIETLQNKGLAEGDTPTIIDADKESDQMLKQSSSLTIPSALSGACFHGEVWVKCPHCKSGNEMMGKQALYRQDGYRIYKCDECGKLFKDR